MTAQHTNSGKGKAWASQSYGSRGITVIELLITISIIAITLSLAIPGYSSLTHKNDIRAASEVLHTTLNVARIEAVKRRQPIRICPTADGATCRDDGDWSGGWLVFDDANTNGQPDGLELIQVVDSLEHGVAIQVSASINEYLQFEPTGIANGNAGFGGEFRICHENSNAYSQLMGVSAAGQVSLEQRVQTDCSA